MGLKRCPDCYEEVTEEYALSSALGVVVNTVSCDIANSIKGFDSFAVIAIILSLLIFVVDFVSGSPRLFYFVFTWPIMPLVTSVLWLYRFGGFKLGDQEYVKAKRAVIGSLTLWVGITGAQIVALIAWNKV